MDGTAMPFPGKEEALELLKRDYVVDRIPEDMHQKLIDEAWELGKKCGKIFLEDYPANDGVCFADVIQSVGLKLKRADVDYVSGHMRYFADIQPKTGIVYIYLKSVELWAKEHNCSYELAENVILMHEFFHYCEYRQGESASRTHLVPMITIGRIHIGKTGVASLSEIAANSFVRYLWDADYLGIRTKWQRTSSDVQITEERSNINVTLPERPQC